MPAASAAVLAQFEDAVGKNAHSSPTANNALRMRAPASSCAQPKLPANQTYQRGTNFYMYSHTWLNDGPEQCVKVDLQVLDGCDLINVTSDNPGMLSLVAYVDSFDRTNTKANYLADIGTLVTDPMNPNVAPSTASMSFMAPAGSNIVFVLTDALYQQPYTKCHYKLTVSSVDAPGEPTAVPTLGHWSMLGLAGLLGLMGLAVVRRRG